MVKLSPELKASAMIRKEVQELKKKMSEELALLRNSQGAFAAKCFAVQRKESDITLSFYCIDLLGHTGEVKAVEFSGDGTLLASGGSDSIVRLWPIRQDAEIGRTPIAPIQMETCTVKNRPRF